MLDKSKARKKNDAGPQPEPEEEKSQEPIGEIIHDRTKEKEKELAEFAEWGEKYWHEVREKSDWKGFDDQQQQDALKIMTEVFLKEIINEQSEILKEEAENISKEIVEKIIKSEKA